MRLFTSTLSSCLIQNLGDITSGTILDAQRPAVRFTAEGARELVEMYWGLVPPWIKEPKKTARFTFNARSDSLSENKPMFRTAFKKQRCLLPATSYFEHRDEGGKKIPYEFTIDGGALYAYAGLWEHREDEP